jgi:hypothetical protein
LQTNTLFDDTYNATPHTAPDWHKHLRMLKRLQIEGRVKGEHASFNIGEKENAGAGGRTRTGTGLLPTDFKSVAATITPRPHIAIHLIGGLELLDKRCVIA